VCSPVGDGFVYYSNLLVGDGHRRGHLLGHHDLAQACATGFLLEAAHPQPLLGTHDLFTAPMPGALTRHRSGGVHVPGVVGAGSQLVPTGREAVVRVVLAGFVGQVVVLVQLAFLRRFQVFVRVHPGASLTIGLA
jgi:hypothetical protein